MHEPAEPVEISGLETLKALTHPRRQSILEYLDRNGPATSTTLGRALNLNTGATSYHLRELARYGLIKEAPEEGGDRRERWWKPTHADIRFARRSAQDDQFRTALDSLGEQIMRTHMREFREALQRQDNDDPWADAFPFSNGSITVTLEELDQFFEKYLALLKSYQRAPDQTPLEARKVNIRFLGFPAPHATRSDTD